MIGSQDCSGKFAKQLTVGVGVGDGLNCVGQEAANLSLEHIYFF